MWKQKNYKNETDSDNQIEVSNSIIILTIKHNTKMELANYILSALLIILALVANNYPQIIKGYKYIPEENKPKAKRLAVNALLIAGISVALLNFVLGLMGLIGVWMGVPWILAFVIMLIYNVQIIMLELLPLKIFDIVVGICMVAMIIYMIFRMLR